MKSRAMTKQFNESPQDKHKAMYGDTNQANNLINAKGRTSESKGKQLFNDRTNQASVTPFHDSNQITSIREQASHSSPNRSRF